MQTALTEYDIQVPAQTPRHHVNNITVRTHGPLLVRTPEREDQKKKEASLGRGEDLRRLIQISDVVVVRSHICEEETPKDARGSPRASAPPATDRRWWRGVACRGVAQTVLSEWGVGGGCATTASKEEERTQVPCVRHRRHR